MWWSNFDFWWIALLRPQGSSTIRSFETLLYLHAERWCEIKKKSGFVHAFRSCKIMSSFAGNENCLIALATSFFKSEAILLQSRLDIFDPVHKNGTLRSSPNSLLVVLGNCHETVFPIICCTSILSQSFKVKIRPTKIRIEWFVFKIRNTVSNIFLFQKYTF